jgi:hypothetical protein
MASMPETAARRGVGGYQFFGSKYQWQGNQSDPNWRASNFGGIVRRIQDRLITSAGRAWSAAKSKTQNASGEAKATTAGAAAGGVIASTAGAKIGIAAFGAAVSGAALLPVVVTVGVGAIVGYAACKGFKDLKARRSQERSIDTTVPPALTDARKVDS